MNTVKFILVVSLFLCVFSVTANTGFAAPSYSGANVDYPHPFLEYYEINREMWFDEMGRIFTSDSYHVFNRAEDPVREITVYLPQGASDVSAYDAVGSLKSVSTEKDETTFTNATISLRVALKENETGRFTVDYQLPWKNIVDQYSWGEFTLNFNFFERFNWTVRQLTVSIMLPEGGEFISSSVKTIDLSPTNTFQEVITFNLDNVTPDQDLAFTINYRYLVLWGSFRPTLWMTVLVFSVSIIVFFSRAPMPPAPSLAVSLETIRRFVTVYEEKMRVVQELKTLAKTVRKRRIPRRRYRLRSKTLEGRISTLSRELTDLRDRIRSVGPRYTELIRRIEVAETELEVVERDLERVEGRHRRGELSSDAYKKLIEDYERRRERAETAIARFLLELREEIR